MDEDLLGFVASSGRRRRVLKSLNSHGAMSPDRLSSMEHIPERMVQGILDDAEERDLVDAEDEEYALTERGVRLVGRLDELES